MHNDNKPTTLGSVEYVLITIIGIITLSSGFLIANDIFKIINIPITWNGMILIATIGLSIIFPIIACFTYTYIKDKINGIDNSEADPDTEED